MTKGELQRSVQQLTNVEYSETDFNSFVQQAEARIFPRLVMTTLTFAQSPMEQAPQATGERQLFLLPDRINKIFEVLMNGIPLPLVQATRAATYNWSHSVSSRNDYGYALVNQGGKQYVTIIPFPAGYVELLYSQAPLSLIPVWNEETNSYSNPSQTNEISIDYPELYESYLSYLVYQSTDNREGAGEQKMRFMELLVEAQAAEEQRKGVLY